MPAVAAPATPTPITYGRITVTDFMGRDSKSSKLTGPPEQGMSMKASSFEEAVTAARKLKSVADPGVRAVMDAGDGAVMLRPVTMSGPTSHLFGSRSFGTAKITQAIDGLLGIFDWAHAVPVKR